MTDRTEVADAAPNAAVGHGPDHALERLVFFSDAVFAIAITLLVIDLDAPKLPHGATVAQSLAALGEAGPQLFGFAVSFWVIGAFWAGHHRAFTLACTHSSRLIGANLGMLFAVVFMPFATRWMSANAGMLIPTALYNASMLTLGVLNLVLVRMATSPPVVGPTVSVATIRYVRRRGLGVVLGAATALIATFIDSRYAEVALISIPLWQALMRRFSLRG